MYLSTNVLSEEFEHLAPVFKKYLFPSDPVLVDALLFPLTSNFTYSVRPLISLSNVSKSPVDEIPNSVGVFIFL